MLVTADMYVVPENLAAVLQPGRGAEDEPRLLLAGQDGGEGPPRPPLVANAKLVEEGAGLDLAGEGLLGVLVPSRARWDAVF
jgi:hypothetical protein